MNCYIWKKYETEPDVHYEEGELRVFDHVETIGISLFEMNKMLENQLQVVGDKKVPYPNGGIWISFVKA